MFKNSNIGGLIRVFPWLKHIIPDYIGYTNMKKVNEAVQELVNESYQKHVETFDSENIRDFTDAYIKQQLGNLFVVKRNLSNINNNITFAHTIDDRWKIAKQYFD